MLEKKSLEHPWLEQIEATLFLQRFPKAATDQELASMLAAVEQLIFSMNEPYAWVVDLGGVLSVSASQRKLFADHENRTKEHDRAYNAGSALYAHSTFMSGIITAVFWLSRPVYPTKVFATIREAERWARSQLKLRGVKIGPEPRISMYRVYAKITG